jgi:hypothetical protein
MEYVACLSKIQGFFPFDYAHGQNDDFIESVLRHQQF